MGRRVKQTMATGRLMRAVRSTRRRIAIKKIRLLGLKKFLSPKAPAHILWLICTGVLSLMHPRKAAPLEATVLAVLITGAPEIIRRAKNPEPEICSNLYFLKAHTVTILCLSVRVELQLRAPAFLNNPGKGSPPGKPHLYHRYILGIHSMFGA